MKRLINYIISFVAGALLLSLFSFIRAINYGEPSVNLNTLILSVLFGGLLGLIIGIWYLRLKENEIKTLRLNQVLAIIQKINQLFDREKDRTRLLKEVCNELTYNTKYCKAVWISLLDKYKEEALILESGWGDNFLPFKNQIENGLLPDCAQNALKAPGVFSTKYPFSTCVGCPLSINCQNYGAMTIRLEYSRSIFGVLSVIMSNDNVLNEREHGLLSDIAMDIAFGLHSIKLEETRKKADEALKESEKRFRDLVENSLTGIFIIQDNKIIYKNPEQERLFGPLPDSFIFMDFRNIHPSDVERVKRDFNRVFTGEIQYLTTDFRFYPIGKMDSRPDMKWVYCRANLIEFAGREAVLINMMDITRSKELENLLMIQDKMTSLGRIAIGIAHEIRNPLSGINIYLSTLEKIYDKHENLEMVKKIIRQIQSASSKIESVIKRVMDFSRPTEPSLVLTDINRPIEEAVNLSSVALKKSGIRIEKSLKNDIPHCYIDPYMICQVILNLITNAAEAIKNIDSDKIIEIVSYNKEENIIIKILDSGPGIPTSIRDRLFAPFFTTKQGNTGIGLSLSQRIIIDHGGSLQVDKSRLGGAEFTINIPIKSE